jgi:hypothetical protein
MVVLMKERIYLVGGIRSIDCIHWYTLGQGMRYLKMDYLERGKNRVGG